VQGIAMSQQRKRQTAECKNSSRKRRKERKVERGERGRSM